MSISADLEREIYEFYTDPQYASDSPEKCLQEMAEAEDALWSVDCHEARPVNTKEKELRVKAKCAKAAQILRAKRKRSLAGA